ncbi:MAG: DUF881 domain-containing protein [Micromonosporaceae bacterium]|nr:DUF881 domain-containing protein [Micromonosporaceae bacterium]
MELGRLGTLVRRMIRVVRPRRRRPTGWSVAVPLVAFAAGLLFTTTATTARGTPLRDDRTPQLSNLIADRNRQIAAEEQQDTALQAEVDGLTRAVGGSDADTEQAQQRGDANRGGAGLVAMHGPGLKVSLDDAPRRADGSRPAGASADDLVVHQQDVQAVVNALWAGGAEAMTIMNVRVISTSAVRCVGNTLLLNGRVYSPPFVINAIGDPRRMRGALDTSDGVRAFREAVQDFGLGYTVEDEADVTLPGYQGSTSLQYAKPVG